MNALCRILLLAVVSLLASDLAPAMAAPSAAEQGRAALEASRLAYQKAGAFRETFEFALEMPGGRRTPRKWEYGVGKSGAFLALFADGRETMRIVARDGRIVGLQIGADKHYVEAPYQGDLAAALRRIGGDEAHLTAPPGVVAAQGGDFAAFLSALRFGILEPLEIAGFQPAAAGNPSALVNVELRAANGSLTIGLDPTSYRLREAVIALGSGAQQVRAAGSYRFVAGDPGAALALPALAGRAAVETFADLNAGDYPVGQPAPKVAFQTLDGKTVRSEEFLGSVVVLDFWATWCVPCWKALEHTSELAAWVKTSGLPVKVFAVDTLEEVSGPDEQRRKVDEFLRARKLDLPVLLDVDRKVFAAFHNPGLPSLVILDREGRIARYHSDVIKDMVPTLRGEIQELLKK